MTGDSRRIVYWDSCIFIAWLTDEDRDVQEMDGISEQLTHLESKKLHLATSVLTLPEVLEMKVTAEVRQVFEKQFQRRNFHLIDTNRRVATIAHDIRNYHLTTKAEFKKIETPDAIHLASAIFQGCDTFYTFDDKLLKLNGMVAGQYKLRIEKPNAVQPLLIRINDQLVSEVEKRVGEEKIMEIDVQNYALE